VHAWIANDPLPKLKSALMGMGVLDEKKAAALEADVKKQVQASIEFARKSPMPQEDVGLSNVFAQGTVSPSQMFA